MAGHRKGVGGSNNLENLEHPYFVTGGNIMSPVAGFYNNITGTPIPPTARGYNKAPGEDPFPISGGAKAKKDPFKAFGLGKSE